MEKYTLNKTPVRTANNFGINDINIELEDFDKKEFENVMIITSEMDKIEINSKLFEKSTIDIFYNIVVTNEGDVSGYVSKIVDYLPKGLTFDVERNEDWYQSEDGVLYYTGLIDKQIMPGERKTISLVLTYESNSIQSRRILNSAELSEISNEKGLTDIDSIVNNKVETEDDYGQVEVLVTISTGTVVNILLIIVIIAIVCGAIIIPPKVYKKIAKRIYK